MQENNFSKKKKSDKNQINAFNKKKLIINLTNNQPKKNTPKNEGEK